MSVWRWLQDAADELFSLNAKLPRTLKLLVVRPGKLTVEWAAGRRGQYVAPLRLFLAVLVVFFALFFALDLDRAGAGGDGAATTVAELVIGEYGETSEQVASRESTRTVATIIVFLVVPLAALILKIFHLRSGRYLVEHAVFALHLMSFGLLAVLLGWGLDSVGDELEGAFAFLIDDLLADAVLLWGLVYTALAIRRAYGLRWPRAVAETAGLLLLLLFTATVAARPMAYWLTVAGVGSVAGAAEGQAYDLLRQAREARAEGDSARIDLLLPLAITSFHRIRDAAFDQHDRYHLAELHLWAGQPFAALAAAERLLGQDSEHPGGLGMAGRAARAAGRDSLARAFYDQYLGKYHGEGRESLVAGFGHEEDLDAFAEEAAGEEDVASTH